MGDEAEPGSTQVLRAACGHLLPSWEFRVGGKLGSLDEGGANKTLVQPSRDASTPPKAHGWGLQEPPSNPFLGQSRSVAS